MIVSWFRDSPSVRALPSTSGIEHRAAALVVAPMETHSLQAKPHAAVLLRTVTAVYDGLGLYDMTQQAQRDRVAEVRAFFIAMLTQLDPAMGSGISERGPEND
jgi:hypothetical protein